MEERYWYNPNLNSRWFFVPGVIGTLTLITIVNLTAFAIVREREAGTLEQILVTPIKPFVMGCTIQKACTARALAHWRTAAAG